MSGTRNYACKEVEANVEHELPNQTEWSATTHATRTCIFRGIVVPPRVKLGTMHVRQLSSSSIMRVKEIHFIFIYLFSKNQVDNLVSMNLIVCEPRNEALKSSSHATPHLPRDPHYR